MAKASTRSLWKGAITFGLVHIPIGLYSATQESDVDFDWLDRRTMDRVGYKRINKRTGREIDKQDVVKGVAYGKDNYVVLAPEEIAEAYPRTTQTIEIEAFVDVQEVPFVYLEKPYYTAPIHKGEKVYKLLRETLRETGKAGLARVVIHSKQHLAVVLPCGPALVLNLLRWGGEVRSWSGLALPPEGKAGLKEAELRMAKHLVAEMSGHWDPGEFRDNFHDAIMKLVEAKAKAGDTASVEPLEPAGDDQGAEILDLTELLRRSLKTGARTAPAAPARKAAKAASPGSRWARQPAQERAAASADERKRSTGKGRTAAGGKTPRTRTTARAKRAA